MRFLVALLPLMGIFGVDFCILRCFVLKQSMGVKIYPFCGIYYHLELSYHSHLPIIMIQAYY